MKREMLKNHLIRNIKRNAFIGVSLFLCSLISLPFSIFSSSFSRENNSRKDLNFSYVIETKDDANYNTSFYKTKSLNSVAKGNNNASVNTYVQTKDTTNNSFLSYQLKDNEVAISDDILNKINVNIGEELELDIVSYEQPIKLKVAAVIPFNFDLFDLNKSEDYSFICLNHSSKFINSLKGNYINFLSSNEYEKFMEQNRPYVNEYDLQQDFNFLQNKTIINLSISSSMLALLLIGLFIVFYRLFKKENKKYRFDNYKDKDINKIMNLDFIIYFSVPFSFLTILFLILFVCKIINLTNLLMVIVFFVLSLCMSFGGRISYGKDNF